MANKRLTEVYASAARTATPTAAVVDTKFARKMLVVIDVTAIVTAPSITVALDGIDPVSGSTFNLLTSAAITATGTTKLEVGPGLTPAANLVDDAMIPLSVQVTVTHANANSITYSVSAITEE